MSPSSVKLMIRRAKAVTSSASVIIATTFQKVKARQVAKRRSLKN